MTSSSPEHKLKVWEVLVLSLLGIAVVVAGVGVGVYFMTHKPQPPRRKPPETAPLVQVMNLQLSNQQVVVPVMGTVVPALEVSLKPRVSGQVTQVHPEWIEGGLVKQGDVLVGIDPSDYELALTGAQTQLDIARAELRIEQGQQDVARQEWDLLAMEEQASDRDRELALRQPYLQQRQAKVAAAEAQVQQATLSLERTRITAPCNAVIQSTDVEVGDQATPQTQLARLVGTDAYWVRVSIPVDELRWVHLAEDDDGPPTAARIETGTGGIRQGRVLKLLSDLEPNGRLARLLVEAPDPLNLEASGEPRKPLLLGEYVRVDLEGRFVNDVFAIPRTALRDGARIWLVDDEGRLRIETVDIVWRDTERAFVRGLEPGTRLVVSDIAAPVDGMLLRIEGEGLVKDAPAPPTRGPNRPGARPKESGQ